MSFITNITLTHYIILSAILFIIGIIGFLIRRNIIIVFMSTELILNAANISFVALGSHLGNNSIDGQIWALFVIAIAASEAAVGLAMAAMLYRNRETINVDEVNELKG